MQRLKLGLWIALVGLVGLLLGYIWGWRGTSQYQAERDRALLRLHLSQAASQMLDGRVSLYTTNFGNASRHFEEALVHVASARDLMRPAGLQVEAAKLDAATGELKEAQTLAQKFNQDANSRAGRAIQLVREVYWATPPPVQPN